MTLPTGRCPAAHPDDPSPCVGPADAVTIVGTNGARVVACVEHGAAMLASVAGARVYPGSATGAAVEVWRAAQDRRAFDFMAHRTVTR